MNTVALNIPKSTIEHAMRLTGKRTALSAITAVVDGAGYVPRAKTKAFRAAHEKGETVRSGGKEAAAFMRKFLGE